MELFEYNEKLRSLKKEARLKELKLAKEYAKSNNNVKVGDVFKDHIGSIKVEVIEYYLPVTIPSCKYYGPELKTDGTQKKNGDKRWAYQINEEK